MTFIISTENEVNFGSARIASKQFFKFLCCLIKFLCCLIKFLWCLIKLTISLVLHRQILILRGIPPINNREFKACLNIVRILSHVLLRLFFNLTEFLLRTLVNYARDNPEVVTNGFVIHIFPQRFVHQGNCIFKLYSGIGNLRFGISNLPENQFLCSIKVSTNFLSDRFFLLQRRTVVFQKRCDALTILFHSFNILCGRTH